MSAFYALGIVAIFAVLSAVNRAETRRRRGMTAEQAMRSDADLTDFLGQW